MSKSLEQLLQKLAETLEDHPEPWYNNPKGYLSKPDYKRAAQDKSSLNKQTILGTILSSNYNTRWFVLDLDKKILSYYKDEKSTLESGHIDMNEITDVQLSSVYDAPEFSLDLVGKDKHYTVVAESHASMVRWAFAFNLARGVHIKPKEVSKIDLVPMRESVFRAVQGYNDAINDSKSLEYSVVFEEPGPLMLNVMGTVDRDRDGNVINNQILVTSFESFPDGRPGRAELSGKISVRDYLVSVNDTDLKKCNFNDAMEVIMAAPWPKTLHFVRDPSVNREASRIESWALVYYPSLNRRRRRYIDLRRNIISFRKPAPGGSASAKRDAFFVIDSIVQIRPIVDKTVPSDQQYTLQLLCKSSAVVHHVDEDDLSLGGSPVDILEICFPKQTHMNSWRSALISPIDHTGAVRSEVVSLPTETIEAVDTHFITTGTKNIGIKNELTGNFFIRDFSLHEGYLKWQRPGKHSNSKTAKIYKGRSLFIANASRCSLTSIRMEEDEQEARYGFKYQLVLQTTEATVTLGMKDETTLKQWGTAVKEVVNVSPPEQQKKVTFPTTIQKIKNIPKKSDVEDEDEVSLAASPHGIATTSSDKNMQGYLFKKGEKIAPGIGSEKFRKRWFVLKHFELLYFRSPAESSNLALALGSMDLRAALEVREATDATSPENALEIITTNRTYVLVAEDEEDQIRWVDALADKLEERKVAVKRETGEDEGSSKFNSHRKELMFNSIQYSGMLAKKTINPITLSTVMLDRFFVIANGSFSYYHTEAEYYDEEKNAIADVSLLNITNVCTSPDSNSKGFDVSMLTRRGGDANGNRIYTLYATDEAACLGWMNAICEAVGTLELRFLGDGIYQSAVNVDAIKQRDKTRVQAAFFKPGAVQNVKKAAGVMEKEEKVEEVLTEEEKHLRSLQAMDRRANTNTLVMGGRGGRGNSLRILANRGDRESMSNRPSLGDASSPVKQSDNNVRTSRNSVEGSPTSRKAIGSFAEADSSTTPQTPSSKSADTRRNSLTPFLGAGRGNRSALTPASSSKTSHV